MLTTHCCTSPILDTQSCCSAFDMEQAKPAPTQGQKPNYEAASGQPKHNADVDNNRDSIFARVKAHRRQRQKVSVGETGVVVVENSPCYYSVIPRMVLLNGPLCSTSHVAVSEGCCRPTGRTHANVVKDVQAAKLRCPSFDARRAQLRTNLLNGAAWEVQTPKVLLALTKKSTFNKKRIG